MSARILFECSRWVVSGFMQLISNPRLMLKQFTAEKIVYCAIGTTEGVREEDVA